MIRSFGLGAAAIRSGISAHSANAGEALAALLSARAGRDHGYSAATGRLRLVSSSVASSSACRSAFGSSWRMKYRQAQRLPS